jgi:tetratricopeptide (TPR) repeat protein
VTHRSALARVVGIAVGLAAATAVAAPTALQAFSAELDAQWDYGRPAESAQRFRAELSRWPADDPQALIVVTQIARAQGLQRRFAEAHATLDAIEPGLAPAPSHVRVRYLLERGRVFNSAGTPERAVPLFAEALTLAGCANDEFYAVDAAHMLGIAAPPPERLDWNLKAVALADAAQDPRARRWNASLYNNVGWTWHDRGDYAAALAAWEKALAAHTAAGNPARIRIAQWTVARGLRSLGRLDEAQAIQLALAAENDRLGTPDGYVYEELAEIAVARGGGAAAANWAAKAHAALKDDPSLQAGDSARLARLARLAVPAPEGTSR